MTKTTTKELVRKVTLQLRWSLTDHSLMVTMVAAMWVALRGVVQGAFQLSLGFRINDLLVQRNPKWKQTLPLKGLCLDSYRHQMLLCTSAPSRSLLISLITVCEHPLIKTKPISVQTPILTTKLRLGSINKLLTRSLWRCSGLWPYAEGLSASRRRSKELSTLYSTDRMII